MLDMKTPLFGKKLSDAVNWRVAAVFCTSLLALHCGESEPPLLAVMAPPAQLSLSPSNPQIAQGTFQKFNLRGLYASGHHRDLTELAHFSVFAPDGSQIPMAEDGLLAIEPPGRYTVSAELNGRAVSTTLTVTAAKLKSVSLSPTAPQVPKGLSQAFTATASFSDGTTQDVTEGASWSEKDLVGSGVALLSSKGVATAKNVGQASISVHYKTVSASTTLTVTAAVLTSLSLSPTNPTLVVGNSLTFSAQGTFSDGTVQDVTAAADWGVADLVGSGVASMEGSTVIADSAGQATISVFYEGLEADTNLTVNAVTLKALQISPLAPSVLKGGTQQFSATGAYSDGTTQDLTKTVSWTATDIAPAVGVASITASGLATGNQGGQATITASYLGHSASTTLTVLTMRTLSFGPMTTLTAGGYPYYVSSMDVNGDGRLDLVSSNVSDNTVGVFLNMGGGSYAAQLTTAVGDEPSLAVPGDFNEDGKLDLVVPNQEGNDISVVLGKGDGTFTAAVDYLAGAFPHGAVVKDFNGDKHLDVAVPNLSGNSLSVYLGTGDGILSTATTISLGSSAEYLDSGDLNGDGKVDLVVGSATPQSVWVLLGNGDGTFATPVGYSGGGGFEVHVQDLNNDGKLDVVTADESAGTVSVLYGNGDGTLGTFASYPCGSKTVSVAVGDLNADGLNDLAATNWMDGTVSILLGKADGTFGLGATLTVGVEPGHILLQDVNGDGLPDVVLGNAGSNTVGIILNTSM
jgi:hypothetical protein